MGFVPDKGVPKFTDLKGMLAQSRETDNALYQTIAILLEWLDQLQTGQADTVNNINNSVNTIFSNVTITPNINATYLTAAYEAFSLPNSLQLIAGANVIFDDSVANKRIISATGSGSGTLSPHHVTHEPGGTDPMAVDAVSTIGSLRTLGTGSNQAAAGNDPRFNLTPPHAPTHSALGTDPVDVKNLAGYPGGTTQYLRADHTFAVPPGGGTSGGMNLDYLGNYVSGPVYNDGDIVIWTDGVAYMCTVDGTTTPPEPWPGAGIAVNGTVDATYWVVSPHSQLTNERAMNGLGTGYVRSTVGEPSVVPTIPLTDTTGILPDNRLTSNVALKNIDNNFVAQTLASYTTIRGANSLMLFIDTTAPVDQKLWRIVSYSNGNLYVEALNDTNSVVNAQFTFGRNNMFSAVYLSGNGANITTLNASNLATGLAAPQRLGNGVPDSTTFLRGDSTWQPVAGVPSGMWVLSPGVPCPVGWTRITTYDGYFLRFGPGGTGGANTHAHTLGNLQIPGHTHPTATTTMSVEHQHGFGIHAYFDSGDNGANQLNVDGGSSGNMARSPHTHRTQIDYDSATGNGGAHDHRVDVPGVGAIGVVGGMDAASNVPLYVDMWICQKN